MPCPLTPPNSVYLPPRSQQFRNTAPVLLQGHLVLSERTKAWFLAIRYDCVFRGQAPHYIESEYEQRLEPTNEVNEPSRVGEPVQF